FRNTGLKDDQALPPTVVYRFTLQAHNSVDVSDVGASTTADVTPSTNNKAVIVSPTTATSVSTCTTATQTNPICVTVTVPSGGGGVFNIQDTIASFGTQSFSNFCGTQSCSNGKGIGSFEGYPPSGYTNASQPIQITVTWDRTAWDQKTATQNDVWFSSHGNPASLLPMCTNSDSASPDPFLK